MGGLQLCGGRNRRERRPGDGADPGGEAPHRIHRHPYAGPGRADYAGRPAQRVPGDAHNRADGVPGLCLRPGGHPPGRGAVSPEAVQDG